MLKEKSSNVITLVEIYKNGPRTIRTASRARAIMDILIEHGYALREYAGASFEGVHRKDAYKIKK